MDVTIEIKIAKDGRQSYRAALQKNIDAQQKAVKLGGYFKPDGNVIYFARTSKKGSVLKLKRKKDLIGMLNGQLKAKG